MKPKQLAELAVLTAVSLIIFIIELRIPNPFPIPGIKLGMANIITVYAVYHYKATKTVMIVAIRLVLGSMFSGNAAVLLYSASGSTLCLLGMLLLRFVIHESHIWLVSIFGAVLHNTGQMAAALAVTQTAGLIAYYPFLLIAGCLAGLFTGLCAQLMIPRLHKSQ